MKNLKSYFKEIIEKRVNAAMLTETGNIDVTSITSPKFMGQWFYEVEKPKIKKWYFYTWLELFYPVILLRRYIFFC